MNLDKTVVLIQMLQNGDIRYKNDVYGLGLYLVCNSHIGSCMKCPSHEFCSKINFASDFGDNFEIYKFIEQNYPELLI